MTTGRNPQVDRNVDWVQDEDNNVLGFMQDGRTQVNIMTARNGVLDDVSKSLLPGAGVAIGPFRVLAGAPEDITAWSAWAVSNQVHTIIDMPPGVTWTPSAQIVIDSAWCELEMNYSVLSAANITSGSMVLVNGSNSGAHNYTQYVRHKRVIRNGMLLGDPAKYTGTDTGADLLTLDIPGIATDGTHSTRVFLERVLFVGGRRNVIFGSGAYFTKFVGCELVRAYQCFDTLTSGVHDYAEQIELTDGTLVAENRVVWGNAAYGQVYTMNGGSIDYNLQIMNGNNGVRVHVHNTHIEHSYGGTAGQTTEPVVMSGAGGYFGGICRWIYTGTAEPYFTSFIKTTNATNQVDLKITKGSRLGWATRTSYSSFHRSIGVVNSIVSIQIASDVSQPSDYPAMLTLAEQSGSYGMIRGGINAPSAGLGHIIGKSGTANAVVNVTATENGVTQPALSTEAGGTAVPMLKLQNGTPGTAAKYYICFPKWERGRKEAWALFVNGFAITSGSFTIKEWRNGPAAVFDGSTFSWASPNDGVSYHGTTVTLALAQFSSGTDWKRYDWRDTAGTGQGLADVQVRHDMTVLDIVEIDVTNCTGPIYIGKIGCGPMGVTR